MPRLMDTSENEQVIRTGNFQFSAVRIENLGATEYTLVTIVCDISGSVSMFSTDLLNCIKSIVQACQKSPRAENLLIRLLTFNDRIFEIHGFKELKTIDVNLYDPLHPSGTTALYEASFDGIAATLEYAKRLVSQDFDCNGAVYIITDGMDNASAVTPSMIQKQVETALVNEEIESLVTILIGLHAPGQSWSKDVIRSLNKFKDEANLSSFVDVGEATVQKLAKLANFVSQSVSSQSQALGTGAPSQALQF